MEEEEEDEEEHALGHVLSGDTHDLDGDEIRSVHDPARRLTPVPRLQEFQFPSFEGGEVRGRQSTRGRPRP